MKEEQPKDNKPAQGNILELKTPFDGRGLPEPDLKQTADVTSLDAASIFGKSNATLQSSVDELLKSISSVESAAGEYNAAHDKNKPAE